MEFKNSLSYRYFKSVCLWSLTLVLTVIAVFLIGYILTVLITFVNQDSNLGQGLGWLLIVLPSILMVIISVIFFAIVSGYFAFILYLEYIKKEQNIPIGFVDKTEQIFNKIIKNVLAQKFIFFISIFSFVLNTILLIFNFYAIIIGLVSFAVLIILHQRGHHHS